MSTDVRLFTTNYVHSINLSGAVVSFLMFLPFLIPVSWENFNYFSRRLNSPLRSLLCCCTVALLLIIPLLAFPNYPYVPHWVFLSENLVFELELWYDPVCYFFYWLALYWVNIGLVFILRSSLTPNSMKKRAARSLIVAFFLASLSTAGFAVDFDNVQSAVVDTMVIIQLGLIILGYSYLLLENRARHSFGLFVGYNLIWNCLELLVIMLELFAHIGPLTDAILLARSCFRGYFLAPSLLLTLLSDSRWWSKGEHQLDPSLLPLIWEILDKYEKIWIHENLKPVVKKKKKKKQEKKKKEEDDPTGRKTDIPQGSYGRVFQTRNYQQYLCRQSEKSAVKIIMLPEDPDLTTPEKQKKRIEMFAQEIDMCVRAQEHENVLPFYGFCLQPPDYGLVFPWAEKGTLALFLIRHPSLHMSFRIELALKCAKAVYHLHYVANILHRDIKCENMLVMDAEDLDLVISDFGSACLMSDKLRLKQNPKGITTPQFRAPELDSKEYEGEERYSTKSDVYSLGCVLWMLGTKGKQIESNRLPINRMYHLEEMPTLYKELVARCLDPDPTKRDEMNKVVSVLKECRDSQTNSRTTDWTISSWLRQNHCEYLEEQFRRQRIELLDQLLVANPEELEVKLEFQEIGDQFQLRSALLALKKKFRKIGSPISSVSGVIQNLKRTVRDAIERATNSSSKGEQKEYLSLNSGEV